MNRMTLAIRLSLIAVIALLALWLAAVAFVYRNHLFADNALAPEPAKIAAISKLVEKTPENLMELTLGAIRTDVLDVRVETGAFDAGNSVAALPLALAGLEARYRPALEGRKLALARTTDHISSDWLARLTRMRRNGLEFHVGLRTGQTLVIDTKANVSVTPLGLPVGFGAGLVGTVVAFLALIVMQRETRPLARLAAAVDRLDLSGGPIALPDVRRSAPEIRAVVGAFDRLQRRLTDLLQGRMVLVGGIAHDVRTFATRLRLRVDGIADDSERVRSIADIEDMISLLDDALLAARVGAGEQPEELVEFDELVGWETRDRVAAGSTVHFTKLGREGGFTILGDRLALRRIVTNIVDNAIKYGQSANLGLSKNRDQLMLTVDDEGPGIPEDKRGMMFEPFTRLDVSRNRMTGGAGLGLAVVRMLVEAHGGEIEILDGPKGARVVVRLPLFISGDS